MIRRLFRLIVLAGAAAGVAAVMRALSGKGDPLPTPATAPTGGAWPPLRNESADPKPTAAEPAAPKSSTPEPSTPKAQTSAPTVSPEPGGVPVATEPVDGNAAWVEPTADGACPSGHPIKAKLKSKIFHAPGQLNYDRTTPDRCYVDVAAAESDGLRAAKR